MRDLKYYDISLRQLRIFHEAAKYESFTKAADHLFITQSLVSKSIASLEDELGFALFSRAPRKVTLSVAGKIIYAFTVKLLSMMEEAISHAENESQRKNKSLVIGVDKTTKFDYFLRPIIKKFHALYPDIRTELELIDINPSIESVCNGAIDISFMMLCNTQNLDGLLLDWVVIKECPHVAFIPKSLSPAPDEKIGSILEYPLIITAPHVNINYYNKTIGIYYEYGIKPNIKQQVSSNTTMLFNLHQGDGMVITNEFMETNNDSNIIPYPIEGTRDALVAFWRKEDQNRLIKEFIKISQDTLRTMPSLLSGSSV